MKVINILHIFLSDSTIAQFSAHYFTLYYHTQFPAHSFTLYYHTQFSAYLLSYSFHHHTQTSACYLIFFTITIFSILSPSFYHHTIFSVLSYSSLSTTVMASWFTLLRVQFILSLPRPSLAIHCTPLTHSAPTHMSGPYVYSASCVLMSRSLHRGQKVTSGQL